MPTYNVGSVNKKAAMLHIALYEPEIPPNTGNIIRLCANTGYQLHLIKPIAFSLDDKRLRRAGLDYHEWAKVQQHDSYADMLTTVQPRRVLAISTKGSKGHHEVVYQADDLLLFGPETRGLPAELLAGLPAEDVVRIPMLPQSRSMNLSNAVAVVLYESWRQLDFCGS